MDIAGRGWRQERCVEGVQNSGTRLMTHACRHASHTSLATAHAAPGEKRLRRLLTRCQEWANPESRRTTVRPASLCRSGPPSPYLTCRIYHTQAELLDSDTVMGPVAAVLRGDANVGELRKARGRPSWQGCLVPSLYFSPVPAQLMSSLPRLGDTDAHDRPGTHVALQERHLVRRSLLPATPLPEPDTPRTVLTLLLLLLSATGC